MTCATALAAIAVVNQLRQEVDVSLREAARLAIAKFHVEHTWHPETRRFSLEVLEHLDVFIKVVEFREQDADL